MTNLMSTYMSTSTYPVVCLGPRWLGGKVLTSGRRVQGSKPDSAQERPCKRAWCTLNPSGPNVIPLVWCGSLERRFQISCLPCHLTVVQNYEVRTKITLMLLQ
ncbi:hypothetical protein AVEN_139643-1 [Araneus ventricosus]|uniref:Uncharacterized protein n=1 Tax=Araneus ventricosus TaxID=182803 RepID=A0A4Y2FU76_ARAVE|nr:hypothetical protein AVEN_139643-1 [Araneus ventricosus]